MKTKKKHSYIISGSSTCREGIIYQLRRKLSNRISTLKATRSPYGFMSQVRIINSYIDLEDLTNKQPDKTWIHISKASIGKCPKQKFLHVTDAIIGPLALLINPDRPRRSCLISTLHNTQDQGLKWRGVDNSILYSPALVAIFTGLYRQCATLCRIGYASQILEYVDRKTVVQIIQQNNVQEAKKMIKLLQSWVVVPVPRNGNRTNIAFPLGYFSRLNTICRAVEKHNTHKVFSKGLLISWRLKHRFINDHYATINGQWSAWGSSKLGSKVYQDISKLSRTRSAPRN